MQRIGPDWSVFVTFFSAQVYIYIYIIYIYISLCMGSYVVTCLKAAWLFPESGRGGRQNATRWKQLDFTHHSILAYEYTTYICTKSMTTPHLSNMIFMMVYSSHLVSFCFGKLGLPLLAQFSANCVAKNRSLLCLLLAWSLLEAESAMATMTMTQTAETETTGEMSVSSSSCGAWDFLNHTFGAWWGTPGLWSTVDNSDSVANMVVTVCIAIRYITSSLLHEAFSCH